MKKMQNSYKMIDFPPLTDEQKDELKNLAAMPESEIDTSDISECNGSGGFYYFKSLKVPQTKIYTAIDNDNLEWLKGAGKGYQQRLNNLIRWARMNHCPITNL